MLDAQLPHSVSVIRKNSISTFLCREILSSSLLCVASLWVSVLLLTLTSDHSSHQMCGGVSHNNSQVSSTSWASFNSVLTHSAWRQGQISQVKGQVPQDCRPPPHIHSDANCKHRLSPVLWPTGYRSESSRTPTARLINLLELLIDSGKHLLTFTSLLKSMINDTDEQPGEERHWEGPKCRSFCPCGVQCVTLVVWLCSPAWKLSEPWTSGVL